MLGFDNCAVNIAVGQAGGDAVTRRECGSRPYEFAVAQGDAVSHAQDALRVGRVDGLFDQGKAMPACLDLSPRQVFQSLRQDFQSLRLKVCRREAAVARRWLRQSVRLVSREA